MTLPRRQRITSSSHGSPAPWAVSYVDMLTLLLCFFIAFFNLEGASGKPQSGREPGSVGSAAIGELDRLIRGDASLGVLRGSGFLEVDPGAGPFFDSGSVALNPRGREAVERLLSLVEPFRSRLHVTVQGHTDPAPVAGRGLKFEDNWELSVLRATSVLKIFISHGYSPASLSAEGFAQNRAPASADAADNRKVTVRIEVSE
jgi:chemotaxis protein MotB